MTPNKEDIRTLPPKQEKQTTKKPPKQTTHGRNEKSTTRTNLPAPIRTLQHPPIQEHASQIKKTPPPPNKPRGIHRTEKDFHVLNLSFHCYRKYNSKKWKGPGTTARISNILQDLATERAGEKSSDLQNPSSLPHSTIPSYCYEILCLFLRKPLVHVSHRKRLHWPTTKRLRER